MMKKRDLFKNKNENLVLLMKILSNITFMLHKFRLKKRFLLFD
ncbi:hypothetical protein CDIMF43_50074 [Carnobacterium divergens]|nr:hypothetical protein CDIMF43_50074 [Carnobacterium divergens]